MLEKMQVSSVFVLSAQEQLHKHCVGLVRVKPKDLEIA